MPDPGRDGLRQRLRSARRAIGAAERAAAAAAVDIAVARLGLPRPGSLLAAYLPIDGELDTGPLLARAARLGCRIYLPEVTDWRRHRMRFVPGWPDAGTPPRGDVTRWFDLVLVPCVGFDADGNRLGMGAGFYDRHFAFLRQRRVWDRPRLLGIGFEAQRVDRLAAAPHDVRLWGVVTERGTYGRAAKGLAACAAEAST